MCFHDKLMFIVFFCNINSFAIIKYQYCACESCVLSHVTFVFIFCVGSRVSTRNSFEMRVDHVTIWVHADGAHEDEPHADEVE